MFVPYAHSQVALDSVIQISWDWFTSYFDHLSGELYVQAQGLFNDVVYTQLIAIIDLAVKQAMLTNDNFEMEFVSPLSNNFINIS